ncbi:retrovirus-related Pol polyprotein from transposon 297 [Trichonephila clavipes]|nr:retrovirus-related Pol polyprotein from transposon 297 [Trichonephila clavipes]
MDFAQLTMALSKAFPSIRNKNDLEIKFYSSQQRRDQEPTDSIYELLKLHKQLGLGMSEEALVDHIFVRLEPQVQDYVSDNVERRGWNERRMSNADDSWKNWRSVDRVTAEMIIGVITRMTVKEISGSTARIDFRGMIEDLTIEDINLEMGVKMRILVEGTAEIEVRVRILVKGYFQLTVNPSDIVKTAFVTKNGTYAFRRMPFWLSGAAPNFQKTIDLILKPVIGKLVSVYMDDVIISSPSFTHHVEHLRKVFRLLPDAGLTLNKEKCKFGCDEFKYLDLIISKEVIKTDETKVRAIVEMNLPKNSKEVSKFLGMSQWYAKFINNFADLCEPLFNLLAEFNIELEHRSGTQNAVADVLSRYPVESIIGEKVTCAVIRDLVLSSREQLIKEQRKDPELDHIYGYLKTQKIARLMRQYAICTAVNETTEKAPAELFLGRKLITPFQKLAEFAVGDIERLFDGARRNTKTKHEKWAKYYDRRRCDMQIKVNDWVLIKTHPLSSATKKVVAKFKPKFEGPYRVLEVKQNNLVIRRSGKRLTVNVDQVRIYHHRKSDEMEIGTVSSDSNSSRHKSSNFESVQRRSNESQYSRKKGSGVKRELEGKGISFLKKIRVRGTQVRPISTDHLSDHPLALGQNPIESLKWVGKRHLRISDRLTLGLEDQRRRLGRV